MKADPKYLRVGNIVDYFNEASDRWLNGHELSNNDMICLLDGRADQADSIPLTVKWLVKFGLINSNGLFKWHRSAIYKGNEKWIYGILGDDNSSYYHVSELQYVHQLQNLYFALTGEELTIKE